jgi:polyisoprenyl-phosphate glycosyltransferase
VPEGSHASAPRYSVVVPVFNSRLPLAELVRRVENATRALPGGYEIVLVDDYSTDDSWWILESLSGEHEGLQVLRLPHNSGQHWATVTGFRLARGGIVVTLDDDLQHPPEEIPKLLRGLEAGALVAIGRFSRSAHPLGKRFVSRARQIVERGVFGLRRPLYMTGFKALRREVVDTIVQNAQPDLYLPAEIYRRVPMERIISVEVRHDARRHGRSQYGRRKSAAFAWNMLRQSVRGRR